MNKNIGLLRENGMYAGLYWHTCHLSSVDYRAYVLFNDINNKLLNVFLISYICLAMSGGEKRKL